MGRATNLAFWALAAFFLLLPFSLAKPGLPMTLGPGEAMPLAMAQSLIHDLDLRCETLDLERLFADYAFGGPIPLTLSSGDGWTSATFTGPLPYPLLAAPLVALFGANGMFLLNAMLALFCLRLCLRRVTEVMGRGTSQVFAFGFFLLSATFLFAFRMRPEMLLTAAILGGYSLLWPRAGDGGSPGLSRALGGGALLGLAVAQGTLWTWPALLLLLELLLSRRPRAAIGAALGLLLSAGLFVGLGLALGLGELPGAAAHGTEGPSVWTAESPNALPFGPELPPPQLPDAPATPQLSARTLGLFLVGRHGGLLPYFPFLLIVLWLFVRGPKSPRRWRLALGLSLLFLGIGLLPWEGGLVGNPHLAPLYPLALFLVPVALPGPTLVGFGLGALFLGMAWMTPFGSPVPYTTAPSHTRNPPLALLPLESHVLPSLPDYLSLEAGHDSRLWFHAADAQVVGDELWILGGQKAELWLEAGSEIDEAVFQVRDLAPQNRVRIGLGEARQVLEFPAPPPRGERRELRLAPGLSRLRSAEGRPLHRLEIETTRGEQPRWRESSTRSFYLGAALTYMGRASFLAQDLYAVEWLSCGAPRVVATGEEFLVLAHLRNASAHAWPSRGAARVRLSYVWHPETTAGEARKEPMRSGLRTDLAEDLPSEAELTRWVRVRAPEEAGLYRLELDPIFEGVSWFSLRNGGQVCPAAIEIRDPGNP